MVLDIILLIFFLLLLIVGISKFKIHPFVVLIFTSIAVGLFLGVGSKETIEVLIEGFSNTIGWIAIVIILGAFIGEVLQETGGGFRISKHLIKLFGQKKLPWALSFTGYLVSIPVFVDVAYILFQPIIESLSVKSKKPVLFVGLALTVGLTVSHTLIPPTPGPMAVASLLNVDFGKMLFINLIIAGFALIGGILWVIFYVKKFWIKYDNELKQNLSGKEKESSSLFEKKSNVLWDVLPILLPIILIGSGSFIEPKKENLFFNIINFLSFPVVAVLIGACLAAIQVKLRKTKISLNSMVEQAILKSAMVIMITGAGGALGAVITETGVPEEIVLIFSDYPFLGIMLPFLVAALLTTSTGSITVSLVGTASMIGPMIGNLGISPEIAAALIGSGSFCVFHANSSFFWILNRLHKVPPRILYKTFTVQSLIMGISGLIGTLIFYILGF